MKILQALFPRRVTRDTEKFLMAALSGIKDVRISMGVPQLQAGLLRFWRENPVREPHYIGFTYTPGISGRFEDPLGRSLRLTDIRVGNKKGTDTCRASIYFSRGLISGYALEKGIDFEPDPLSVDMSDARVEFLDPPDRGVEALIDERDRKFINWSDVFEVNVNGKQYFHIKGLDDGDFIAVDSTGSFFEITHDPLQARSVSAEKFRTMLAGGR